MSAGDVENVVDFGAVLAAPNIHHLHHHSAIRNRIYGNRRSNKIAGSGLLSPPESLFNICVSSSAAAFYRLRYQIRVLPADIRLQIYERIYDQGLLCQLGYEWCDLDVFEALLKIRHKWYEIHRIFQALIDHGLHLSDVLIAGLDQKCGLLFNDKRWTIQEISNLFDLSFELGRFFLEAGWYMASEHCFRQSLRIIDTINYSSCYNWKELRRIEIYHCLLEVCNYNCDYREAQTIFVKSQQLLSQYRQNINDDTQLNLPIIFIQYALLHFNLGSYDMALTWAIDALRHIVADRTPVKTVIDVCRHASKMLLVRRQFAQSKLLITHALMLTKHHFDECKRYSCTLLDFGLFLMNMDKTEEAVKVYQKVLDYRQLQFGGSNLKIAQAYEDLAYALYVQEYCTGNFGTAKHCAEKAIEITRRNLPDNHLLLASCKRVKALILEEMAIDSTDETVEKSLLFEAEELHLSALTLYKRLFGDENVQTAKHYGNLGRLYQSMRRFPEAEMMHKKAIEMKRKLLGADDYELALSIGHLASLYNHDLERYDEAESLYIRSIEIVRRLFGDTYSGLEYDYRGLVQVYTLTGNAIKAAEYLRKLGEWKIARDREVVDRASTPDNNNTTVVMSQYHTSNTTAIIEEFFKKYQ